MGERWAGVDVSHNRWMSVQQGKWRVPSWSSSQFLSFSSPHPVGWIYEFLHHNVSQVKIKESELGSQVRIGNFIRGKRESDWPLRRTSILPFWWSPTYIPPMKNPLKGWSHSWRSEIWWSCSFEKIGASEITWCHLGNLVSLTDHCDFILCLQGRHNKPFYQWDPMWTLSVPVSLNLLQDLLFVDLLFVCLLCFPFVVWWFPFVLCFCSLTFGFCESVLCFSSVKLSWNFNWGWFSCFFILLMFFLLHEFRRNNYLLWSWRAIFIRIIHVYNEGV